MEPLFAADTTRNPVFSPVCRGLLAVLLALALCPCLPARGDPTQAEAAAPFPAMFSPAATTDRPAMLAASEVAILGPWASSETELPRLRFRGRLDADALWASQSAQNEATFGDMNNVVGLRRAWVGMYGYMRPELRYIVELDLAAGTASPRDIYLGRETASRNAEHRFGHFREPFSLEGGTASYTFAFMERSPINQLDPARSWGLGYFRHNDDEDMTFAIGAFHAGTGVYGWDNGPGSEAAVTARWTGLPWVNATGSRLCHVGIALSSRVPKEEAVIINQHPRSPLLDFGDSSSSPFIPQINIPADFQQLVNLQSAYVRGPFSMQAEWYGSWIDQIDNPSVFFHGSYVQTSYFLTGEVRSYQRRNGVFGDVTVNRPVLRRLSPGREIESRGPGAWEVTARMSYLDYFDSNTPTGPQGQLVGIRLPQLTLGANWYLADHMRLMFNYSLATPDEPNTGTSTASLFSSRLALHW